MTSPVFFDHTGNRRRLVGRLVAGVLALVVLVALGFALTVVRVPSSPAIDFGRERQQPLPFLSKVAHLRHRLPALPRNASATDPLRIGFYVPWDVDSALSLRRHFDELDWIVATNATIMPDGSLNLADDPRLRALYKQRLHRPQLYLMVQNASQGKWDSAGIAGLLADRTRSHRLVDATIAAVSAVGWQGAVFDVEQISGPSLADYQRLLEYAHTRFAAAGLKLVVTAPGDDPAWNLARLAAPVDYLIVMDYDQHTDTDPAGPVAAQDWFSAELARARAQVPQSKLIVALGGYGYDWHGNGADPTEIDEAWRIADDADTMPQFDPASGNIGFAYEQDGEKHTVWALDAASNWNQLQLARGVKGVAIWRLGGEDPGFWEDLAAMREKRLPRLESIPPADNTEVDGNGEVLRIADRPRPGSRAITFNRDGMITAEQYHALSSPYVVSRTGGADPKAIALTFDDGPNPDFTPKILDILEAKHAPGTFFVIGENALEHPAIINRIVADGFELGNHSYTHPNLAEVSDFGTGIELNATQRLIEAYTGRSTRLFRAPYFGDAEPTTTDELRPADIAQSHGYTIVGLHVDPLDWRTPGVQAIVNTAMASIHEGQAQCANDNNADSNCSRNIVLLHDGGGDRSQTVAALPLLIDRLRAEGYRLVSIADLAGQTHDAVNPPVSAGEKAAVRFDVGIFLALAGIGYLIKFLFFLAIALGIARAVLLTLLALIDRVGGEAAPVGAPQPLVSVIIPAYNEERVIVSSIARVLASDYPALELIVADDGSKDQTSAMVSEHYGHDPRVVLMTLTNGGKASALNRALAHSSGEIVIALDADTQFLPETIARLVRWFADPRIGAVAGNAQVGNLVNLVTRWQAIEYVTAQNVERRALDSLRAITVVPGAVGAWRRAALDAVGGYPEDTLAEDQDLTIAIQRAGWHVGYDVEAVALTEAPETYRALARQRYRWSFGTLQCLWKHRVVLRSGRPRGLAWFGMPQAWLFQIVFAAISPMIDLALVLSIVGTAIRIQQHGWAQTQSDVLRMGVYWLVFTGIDLIAGWISYRLDPVPKRFPALLMVAQRFVYRQLMYSVVIRSINSAIRGRSVAWGKLERTGSVVVDGQSAP